MSLFDFFRPRPSDSAKSELWQFKHWQVQVIRSQRRKTLSLELKPDHPIIVRTNKSTRRKEIEKILLQKQSWLEKNLDKLSRLPKLKPPKLRSDDKIYFLGKKWPIRRSVTTLKSAFLVLAEDHLKLLLPAEMMKEDLSPTMVHQILRQFYLREGKKYLPVMLNTVAERTQLAPQRLRIGYMNSRWGSCSSKRAISLNAKIMAAPSWVIESVIVHELCHLKHMNHSKEYWKLANAHFAKHDEADRWLHEHLS